METKDQGLARLKTKHAFTTGELKELGEKFPNPSFFMDSIFQNFESETIVVQTIHAGEMCLKAHGESFSFRCDSVLAGRTMDGTDNGNAYGNLVSEGYLIEEKRKPDSIQGKLPADLDFDDDGFLTLIFMTDRLVKVLEKHGNKK